MCWPGHAALRRNERETESDGEIAEVPLTTLTLQQNPQTSEYSVAVSNEAFLDDWYHAVLSCSS